MVSSGVLYTVTDISLVYARTQMLHFIQKLTQYVIKFVDRLEAPARK